MTDSRILLRLGAALFAVVAGAGGIVVAVLLLRSEPGPVGSTAPAVAAAPSPAAPASLAGGRIPTPVDPGYPSPPEGAVVLAREAGSRALAFGIVRGKARSLVRVSVLSPAGPGAAGLAVSVRFDGGERRGLAACGKGCYQATFPAAAAHGSPTVEIDGTAYAFAVPPADPPDGTAIVKDAAVVWKHLSTVVWHERLAASPTDALHTVYRAVAPDELSYDIEGSSSSVIIGHNRWDRSSPTAPWMRSRQDPALVQPLPAWVAEADVHVLGSGTVAGQRVWDISFFDPETPAWFELKIAKASHRTLELSMIAAAHFMHHVYGPFDSPFHLHPP
ncbi:MAG TPA: hypothetical protein VGM80_15845 [Gaiellaceae bacterium]